MIFKTTLNIITERFLHVKQLLPQFVIQPLWSQIFTLRPQIRVSTFPGRLKADKDCSHSEGSVCSGPTCRRHQVQFTRNTQKAHLRSRNEWNNNFCLLKWICTSERVWTDYFGSVVAGKGTTGAKTSEPLICPRSDEGDLSGVKIQRGSLMTKQLCSYCQE